MELPMRIRFQVIAVIHARYQKASKGQKHKILDEMVATTGYNRKYAAWMLAHWGTEVRTVIDGKPTVFVVGKRRIKKRGGRPRIYNNDVVVILVRLWYMFDCLCSKRFVAFLRPLVDLLCDLGELEVTQEIRDRLHAVSPSTVDRLLAGERKQHKGKGSSLTHPGSLLKRQIPVRTFADWDDIAPGFVEADLVGHDGGSAFGSFLCTLTMTDVCSGWTEMVGVLNKAKKHVFQGLQCARERFPVPLLGLDTDNGSEFLNNHLVRYCVQEHITFTRSRPYRKNDNCFVEEKNNSIVRRSVGYARFESEEALLALNALYGRLRLLSNFFFPSAKLLEKTRDGSKLSRKYDSPLAPYQRLLCSDKVTPEIKEILMSTYKSLNPAQLAREIHARQDALANFSVRYQTPARASPPRSFHIHPGLSPRSPSSRF